MTRLRERVQQTVEDVDKFMDAEISDDDKTYMKYHAYRIIGMLNDLIE